jgi:hypothetical protein
MAATFMSVDSGFDADVAATSSPVGATAAYGNNATTAVAPWSATPDTTSLVIGGFTNWGGNNTVTQPTGWTAANPVTLTGWDSRTICGWRNTAGNQASVTWTAATAGNSNHVVMLEIPEGGPSVELEQEGFRWRNDDGSETTATWAASQDSNLTAALGTQRLRALVNATLDPASIAYTLRYKKSTDSVYRPVPTSSALTTAFGALGTAPATNSTSTIDIAYPAGIAAGDLLIVGISSRLGSTSIDAEGFSALANNTQNVATSEGTAGTEAADAGGVRVTVFYKVADGTETGAVTFANSGTASISKNGRMLSFTKPFWATWDLADCNGKMASGSTSWTAAMGSDPGIAVGDILLAVTALNTDAPTASSEAVTGTGLTSALTTEHMDAAGTGGNDTRLIITEHSVSAALTSGVPTYSFTASTGTPEGATVLTRIRATGTPPVIITASSNITGGGEATTAQLTAPSGKSTSDFVTGRMWDDENGADSIDITTDDYTELEWCFKTQSPATTSDIYQFRVYAGSTPLNTYTVTPEWTIGTGGQTVNLGIATETDTALAITHPKSKAIGIAGETDTALAIAKAKRKAIGVAGETDTAMPIAPTSIYAVGIAGETDSALAIAHRKLRTLGIALETESAGAIARTKTKTIGIATETDTAIAITHTKRKAIGIASETDTAFALARSKRKAIGIAGETDTALALTRSHLRTLGIAGETDTALAVARSKRKAIGIALETDESRGVTPTGAYQISAATETDSALALTHAKRKAIGIALETDAAVALTRVKAKTLGVATETDAALAVAHRKLRTIGVADETDLARPISITGAIFIGTATETDTALRVFWPRQLTIGIATELDSALPITRSGRTVVVGTALEVDTALALGHRKFFQLGTANEVDLAVHIVASGGAALYVAGFAAAFWFMTKVEVEWRVARAAASYYQLP